MIRIKRAKTLLLIAFVFTLSACSTVSNTELIIQAIRNSSIGDSTMSYNGKNWFDFRNQDSEIQDIYLTYLIEISDCLSKIKTEKIKEREFDGVDTFLLKLQSEDKNYALVLRYVYPDTSYLKISIDNKTEYFFLDQDNSKKFSDIILNSDNNPFGHINLLQYLENERKILTNSRKNMTNCKE